MVLFYKRIAQVIKQLLPFIPEGSASFVEEMLKPHHFLLKVVRPRKTKLGDFRPGLRGRPHQLTVNGDLHPYHFLLTLVHEIAHMKTFEKYSSKVNPHGVEWQSVFQQLMHPILDSKIYPPHVEAEIARYLSKPKASCSADTRLLRVLREEDEMKSMILTLEDLPENAVFRLGSRPPMRKGKKRRTRFLCEELGTGRTFAVHPLAEVIISEREE